MSLLGCQAIKSAGSTGVQSAAISGSVHGGQQPVSGAIIQLYAAGNGGDGSAATALLTRQVTTDNAGLFNLTGLYQCPGANAGVYLVATGGNPGLGNGQTNAQIALMVALGPCGDLTASTAVEINEVTTVAAAYALAPYMQGYGSIGSSSTDAQMMADAFTMAAELANTGSGASPGVGVPTGQVVPSQKLNTLADILSACINSTGGLAGDSSSCGHLFSLASAGRSSAPTDTVGAVLDIAENPTSNVVPIFDLNPSTEPFQPSLSAAPVDWTLGITSAMPSPTFSPAPGSYGVSPSITLSDTNSSAAIYYTTNGSTPTSSSLPYAGAFAVSDTTTVRAVAIAGGISSLLVAGTYALPNPGDAPWVPPVTATLVFLSTPANVVSGSVINPAVQVALEDPTGAVYTQFEGQISISLASNTTGAVLSGTLSATAVNGIATFSNATVTLPGSGFQIEAIGSGITSGLSASFTAGSPLHQVDLSWNAPSSSPDPVAGYNVYRSSDGGNTYQVLNSGVDTTVTYVDTLVLSGQPYDYYVTSVDSSGVESVPSNTISVTIP
jgi:hypothetical protein